MTNTERIEAANKFNDDARTIEAQLEELGRSICDLPGSYTSWCKINHVLADLHAAIDASYGLYPEA